MQRLRTLLARARGLVWRPANIPAAIALCVVVAAFVFAESQSTLVHRKAQEADVISEVSLIRSRLEGNIIANIKLARGLASVIATEPGMDQARFSDLASSLFDGDHQLRSMAAAPDLVVEMVHPVEGNRSVVGLDYNRNEAQKAAALRARETGEVVLAGPVDLVQGGQGFVARIPVFSEGDNGTRTFWGLLAIVIDLERLYRDSGLYRDDGIAMAMTGKDATGASGPLFFGDGAVLGQDPVTATVELPHGSWQIAAIPAGGWGGMPDNVWMVRGTIAVGGLLVVLPVLVMGQLLTERVRNRLRLRVMSRRLELALRASQIGVWELDPQADELYWDRRMRNLYDAPPTGPLTYDIWESRLHPEDRERAIADFRASLEKVRPYHSNYRLLLANGTVRHVRAMGSVYLGDDGHKRIVGVNWDATADVNKSEQLHRAKLLAEARNDELEQAKSEIETMAMHDALTGLPNRRFLDDHLARLDTGAAGEFGLLHIDLDRFKQINDTLGHAAGDAMLVRTANILRANAREGDIVARIGGDEFVIVCSPQSAAEGVEQLAERIVRTLREPFDFDGRACRAGVSIGVAMSSSAAHDPRQLLINADIALYRAKNEGRNGYRFFSSELHRTAVSTKRVADEILAGIENREFIAHYQGQFDAHTHELVGVEALARWKHPQRGLLPPAAFVDIAEDLNVLATIDEMVLDAALAQRRKWKRAGVGVPRVAVNVSARRLNDPELVASLEKLDFEPGTLAFELVESTFLDQSDEQVAFNLDRIRDLGIDIEIDDFGTGYASIVSLTRLRPDRLKIDRQLVLPLTAEAAQRDLVRSIVDIGASMNIEAVAEGVETMDHAAILLELGCSVVQGYAFAKPMSGRSFTTFARQHAARIEPTAGGGAA